MYLYKHSLSFFPKSPIQNFPWYIAILIQNQFKELCTIYGSCIHYCQYYMAAVYIIVNTKYLNIVQYINIVMYNMKAFWYQKSQHWAEMNPLQPFL